MKVEQVQNAVRMSRERGIQSGMFLMWGYEGEEMEDIEATVQHVSKSSQIFFSPRFPIRSRERRTTNGLRIGWCNCEPWGKTSDREFRIKGRHSRQFYAQADKLLRDEVERARLLQAQITIDGLALATLNRASRTRRAGMQATYAEVEQ